VPASVSFQNLTRVLAARSGNIASGVEYAVVHEERAEEVVPASVSFQNLTGVLAARSGNIASGVEYAVVHKERAEEVVPAKISFCGLCHYAVSISYYAPSNRGMTGEY
jgi:hypothetical protein